MRLVDADALITAICEDAPPQRATTWAVEAIDAAKIVCCAVCRYMVGTECTNEAVAEVFDTPFPFVDATFGCAYLERRTP